MENSLHSIQKAKEKGAQICFLDLQETSDGEIICFSEDTVGRLLDGSGKIAEMSLSQIRSLRPREYRGPEDLQIVPTLQEAIAYAGEDILLEVEPCKLSNKVRAIVKECGALDKVIFRGEDKPSKGGLYIPVVSLDGKKPLRKVKAALRKHPVAVELHFDSEDNPYLQKALQKISGKARICMDTGESACGSYRDPVDNSRTLDIWYPLISKGVTMFFTNQVKVLKNYLASGAYESKGNITDIVAVSRLFPDGQKVSHVIVEYAEPVSDADLSESAFEVEGRTVTKVYASPSPGIAASGKDGRYVIIELDTDNYSPMVGPRGPYSRANVRQKGDIHYVSGDTVPAQISFTESPRRITETPGQFSQGVYNSVSGASVQYNLYVPSSYYADGSKQYPLVVFVHDAGRLSDNVTDVLSLEGAKSWTVPSEQESYPCFVLAPQYGRIRNGDDVEATYELIMQLTEDFRIDKGAILGTGQSMGCMQTMSMDMDHPDLFAATLLVSGQLDPEQTTRLAGHNMWIVVSEDDERAFPGMNAIVDYLEGLGSTAVHASISALSSQKEFASHVEELLSENKEIKYTSLTAGTLPKEELARFSRRPSQDGGEGMRNQDQGPRGGGMGTEQGGRTPQGDASQGGISQRPISSNGASAHMASFDVIYRIDAFRHWLLSQHK